MTEISVSIIIPTHNEGNEVIDTIECILRDTQSIDREIIVVDDGSDDHSVSILKRWSDVGLIQLIQDKGLGVAGARNKGASIAKGRYLGFVDGHCYLPPGWLDPLVKVMEHQSDIAALSPAIAGTRQIHSLGYGGTWNDDSLNMHWLPYKSQVQEVPFLCGACQLVRREAFEKLGGYDKACLGWGSEDLEICIRFWLFGYRVVTVSSSTIYHKFRKTFPYAVDTAQILYNKMRMIFLHFEDARLRRLMQFQLNYPGAENVIARIYGDDSIDDREKLHSTRHRNMDWFCDRFQLVS